MSYVVQLSHIIINTKERKMVLNQDSKNDLFRYIWGIITNMKCRLYRINGIGNHIHMLVGLHQSVCLMDLMREIKRSSSIWIKEQGESPYFEGWAREYAAFSVSWENKERVINYIKNQEVHHSKVSFDEEYKAMLLDSGMEEYNM